MGNKRIKWGFDIIIALNSGEEDYPPGDIADEANYKGNAVRGRHGSRFGSRRLVLTIGLPRPSA
jgi:hypothetical protein